MSTPTTKLTRELIRMACCAPSIHNTQPWAWRLVGPDTIELYADRSRQLEEIDPQGRALAISCGAALHHLVVAAEGFGLVAETRLLPPGHRDSNLLATIHLEPGEVTPSAVEMLTALENRATDRRGFTDWEVPATRLQHLAKAATGWGAHAVSVTDPGLTATVSSIVEQARTEESENPRIAEEQASWVDHGPDDGVPVRSAFPHPREGIPPRRDRFNLGPRGTKSAGQPASGDVFMLVYTSGDDLRSWLAAGQALSALWIRATLDGLSLTPETQAIELEAMRRRLRHSLLDDLGQPQVLVRVGWQETSRSPQERTPRRSLDDVLLP